MSRSTAHRALAASEVASALEGADLLRRTCGPPPRKQGRAEGLASDSREVVEGGLFVAVPGHREDGLRYVEDAVGRGARLVVAERCPDHLAEGVTVFEVSDARRALARLADRWFDRPTAELRLVGITGTNGKTTTASLTHQLLEASGLSAGWIGTLGARIGDEVEETGLTTPGAIELHGLLDRMRGAGCEAAVIELSSHALDQLRIEPAGVEVGVFTNLSHDHLDYHGSFEAYRAAKRRLFAELEPGATALINADDAAGAEMAGATEAEVVRYGSSPDADCSVSVRSSTVAGLDLRIDGFDCRVPLTGRFNAYNVAAAYGASTAVRGTDRGAIRDHLSRLRPVPGRMEGFRTEDGRRIVVDYAHTPDALERVLETLREAASPETRIWCVFGCGGDRDRAKRSRMGRVAELGADRVIVTSDNPRTEDPEAIIRAILEGIEAPERVDVEVDRRAAIRKVAEESDPGDLVLVAGRGHETVQEVGSERRALDDRAEVQRWFSAHPEHRSSPARP